MQLENISFTVIKQYFFNDVDIGNIFIFKKISSSEKNYKYFIGYGDEYKIKLFSISVPKTNAFVKSYSKTKCIYSWLKMRNS